MTESIKITAFFRPTSGNLFLPSSFHLLLKRPADECDFSPLKRFSIIFFCIFVGNFKRVKRLRTQGNALKRDFRMENRRFESNE